MTDQPDHGHPTDSPATRDSRGRYVRQIETAERETQALALRARKVSYDEIARRLGYADRSGARKAVERAIAARQEEPAAEVRTLELEALEVMERAVLGVMEREHVTVQHGKVIKVVDDGGKEVPLLDDSPVLAAVDRWLKIQERRARLLGLDAEQKVNVSGGVRYEVVGVEPDALT
jgi:hypothetical protein